MLLGAGLLETLFTCSSASAQPATPTPAVKVSALDDVSFGVFTGDGDMTAEDAICVFNNQSPDFSVTFFTSSGSFGIANGGNSVPFTVRFRVEAGGYTAVPYNSAVQFSGAHVSSHNCNGGTNAAYEIKMSRADLLSVRPGNYSATLYMVIEQPL